MNFAPDSGPYFVAVPAVAYPAVLELLSDMFPNQVGDSSVEGSSIDALLAEVDEKGRRVLHTLSSSGEDGVPIAEMARVTGFDSNEAFGGWFGAFKRRCERVLDSPLPLLDLSLDSGRSYALEPWFKSLLVDGFARRAIRP